MIQLIITGYVHLSIMWLMSAPLYHQNNSPPKSASLRRIYNRSWFIQDQRIARYLSFIDIRTLYLICIFSTPSYLMDRPNHVICHVIYLPVFPFTLSLLYSSLFNVTWCICSPKSNKTHILLLLFQLFSAVNLTCR
jgi:hypothetical protein